VSEQRFDIWCWVWPDTFVLVDSGADVSMLAWHAVRNDCTTLVRDASMSGGGYFHNADGSMQFVAAPPDADVRAMYSCPSAQLMQKYHMPEMIQFDGDDYQEWDGGVPRDEFACLVDGCLLVTAKGE